MQKYTLKTKINILVLFTYYTKQIFVHHPALQMWFLRARKQCHANYAIVNSSLARIFLEFQKNIYICIHIFRNSSCAVSQCFSPLYLYKSIAGIIQQYIYQIPRKVCIFWFSQSYLYSIYCPPFVGKQNVVSLSA